MRDASDQPLVDAASDSPVAAEVDAEAVRDALDAPDPTVRRRAVEVCETLVEADVDRLEPVLGRLCGALSDESAAVARPAAALLQDVVAAEPELLAPHAGALVAGADTDLGGLRLDCAQVLAAVAVEHPGAVVPHADRLASVLLATETGVDDEPTLPDELSDSLTRETVRRQERVAARERAASREVLANVLVAAAEAEPSLVADEGDVLRELLADEDPVVVGGALDAFAVHARAEAASADVPTEAVLDRLDHRDRTVRARAVRLLGFAGDAAAVPPLERVAETDADDDVAALAAETAAFLAE